MIDTIARHELMRKMEAGERFTLIETLAGATYLHGHLPGALNLPPDQVTELAPTMLPDLAAEIVVYCASPT